MRVSPVIDNECTSRNCRRGYIGVYVTTSKQIAHAQRKLIPFPAPASTLHSASWVVDRVYVKDSCQVCCTSVRLWLYLFALQTRGVHMIRMEVTLGTFPALTIQSTTRTRRDVPGVSQYPVPTAYWLHLMNSTRRETPMFWKSTMALPIQAMCCWPWVVICRAPPMAPVDLLYGSSSQLTGVSLQKDST